MEEVTPGFKVMLDEAQKHLERQIASSMALREYAKTIIGVSSAIVSFFAAFKLSTISDYKANPIYIFSFLFMILLYGILMISAIGAVKPQSIELPIKPNDENFKEAYADRSEFKIASIQIKLYLRAIEKNNGILAKQIKLSDNLGYLLGAVVILILIVSLSPLLICTK